MNGHDYPNLIRNPLIFNPKETYRILKKYKINMNSITCDFYRVFLKKCQRKTNYRKLLQALKKKIILVIPLVDNSSIKNKRQEIEIIKFFRLIYEKHLKGNSLIICFESDYTPTKLKNLSQIFQRIVLELVDTGNSASLGTIVKMNWKF